MIVAVDTGGTKTLFASFGSRGNVLHITKVPTPQDSAEYIALLVETIRSLTPVKAPSIISIALPDIQIESMVEQFSNLPWKHFDVRKELTPHFPNTTILVGNDAKLGGLGEVRNMQPTPRRALYVTISTGIGTGVISDGKIDPDFIQAEGGHMMLEYDGITKEWEKFASGRAIKDVYGKNGSEIHSRHIWNEIADRISRGFLALLPIIQPDVVIIGGSMGTHFYHFNEKLDQLLEKKLPPTIKRPVLMQAKHPEEAVMYGCYYYALDAE